jgi:hypothetical protein
VQVLLFLIVLGSVTLLVAIGEGLLRIFGPSPAHYPSREAVGPSHDYQSVFRDLRWSLEHHLPSPTLPPHRSFRKQLLVNAAKRSVSTSSFFRHPGVESEENEQLT